MNATKDTRAKLKYKRIAVDEHFSTPEHLDNLRAILDGSYPVPEVMGEERFMASDAPFLPLWHTPHSREMIGHLLDVGGGRLQVMDKTGIDMQVLSLVAPEMQVFDAV